MKADDNMEMAILESELTIKKSLTTGMQLRKLQSTSALKLIIIFVKKTAGFYNVGHNMTEQQIIDTSQIILTKYGYDNLEDIILALRKAREGNYSKVYNRVDGEVILNWLSEYFAEKAEELEKLHTQQKAKKIEISNKIAEKIKPLTDKKTTSEEMTTRESWRDYVLKNLNKHTTKQLKSYIKTLENDNIFGGNDEFIDKLKKEIERR